MSFVRVFVCYAHILNSQSVYFSRAVVVFCWLVLGKCCVFHSISFRSFGLVSCVCVCARFGACLVARRYERKSDAIDFDGPSLKSTAHAAIAQIAPVHLFTFRAVVNHLPCVD